MDRYKYGRTFHFPFSLGLSNDDKLIPSLDNFIGKRVVVTLKLDGENTSMYPDYIHARSIDSKHHESRSWIKKFHSEIRFQIPEGWRICGENMYARHSIAYDNLESYFYCFNIWNEKNECLPWDETIEWCKLLGIESVEVLYDGVFDFDLIEKMYYNLNFDTQEGIVVRLYDGFKYEDFSSCVVKAVRKNHVQTTEHWMFSKIEANGLKGK